MAAMNKLGAWSLTAGNITKSNMHPKFAFRSDQHQALISDIFEQLDVNYSEEQSGISFDDFLGDNLRHAHPGKGGAVLGRILSVLGAPVGSHTKGLLSLPPYLGSVSKELKQSFARIVILNRYRKETEDGVQIAVPHYSRILGTSLFNFFKDLGGRM